MRTDKHAFYERARKYISQIPGAISGAGGHKATFRVACVAIHGFGLGEIEKLELLREYNQRCDPLSREHELIHKVKGAAAVLDYLKKRLRDGKWMMMAMELTEPALSITIISTRPLIRAIGHWSSVLDKDADEPMGNGKGKRWVFIFE